MKKEMLIKYLKSREFDEEAIQKNVLVVEKAEDYLGNMQDVKTYISHLIDIKENSLENLISLARYFYAIDEKEIYVYFTSLFGASGVVDHIRERVIDISSEETAKKIFDALDYPELGKSRDDFPVYTKELMKNMNEFLTLQQCRKALAGNNHGIPEDESLEERKIYIALNSLDDYLMDRHKRKVQMLQEHVDQNKLWFEQVITQEIVDYVGNNQEILSGVRKGNKLYVTKFPYNPKEFLQARDEQQQRYHTCHCTFAKESILSDDYQISGEWCYCSGGFAKYPFEVILDKDLEVEVIENVLDGDLRCRFVITLPEEVLAKS